MLFISNTFWILARDRSQWVDATSDRNPSAGFLAAKGRSRALIQAEHPSWLGAIDYSQTSRFSTRKRCPISSLNSAASTDLAFTNNRTCAEARPALIPQSPTGKVLRLSPVEVCQLVVCEFLGPLLASFRRPKAQFLLFDPNFVTRGGR
jgi:hypothetical protein